jgi:hypothetical protein
MTNKLQGLTHAEHQFCAAALAQVQHTCASSDLLRDHTIGPRLKKIMRRTETLRRYLERHCDGYGMYNSAEQNVVLSWVELRKTLAAVSDTINGKVSARVLDAYLGVWRATNMTVYKLQECELINNIDWELFLAARPSR